MIDLVSRQDAIEIIQSMYPGMPRVPWRVKRWQKRYEPYIRIEKEIKGLPSAQPEIIRCEGCMHNGSFDTDCPIDWAGKDYCNFAERRADV